MKKLILPIAVMIIMLFVLVFAYNSVTFDITTCQNGEGSVLCEQRQVHLFETTEVRISPCHDGCYYVIEKVTLNGEDVTNQVRLENLTLRHITKDQNIVVEFSEGYPPAVASSAAVFV